MYIPVKTYEVVLSMFHVMSYQIKNEDLIRAFKTASKALEKGGLFIFDCWYGPGVLTDKPAVRVKKVQDNRNTFIRYANPVMHIEANSVDVNYDILVIDNKTGMTKELNEVHSMRYFFNPEIEIMLEMTGFSLIECLSCDTLRSPDFNTWTTYFIARKVA